MIFQIVLIRLIHKIVQKVLAGFIRLRRKPRVYPWINAKIVLRPGFAKGYAEASEMSLKG